MPDSSETVPRPDAQQVGAWVGHRLDEIGGANVGKVEGVFCAEAGGEPEWLLARMGRFGHYTLIPGRDAVEGVGRVWVPYGREQIRGAPRVEPNGPLRAGAERTLLEHYGIAVSEGRAAELEKLDDGEVSAQRTQIS